jgi:release factor glutamine methyltransferase
MNSTFEEYLVNFSENISILDDKNEETPGNTLKSLWLAAAGTPVSALKAEHMELPELSALQFETLNDLVRQRLDNMPLAYITGRQQFMGMEMLASPDALIPRKETEILGQAARDILQKISGHNSSTRVIDVCTGAGNIACALADGSSDTRVYASDLSEKAIMLARMNADFTGVSDQVEFFTGDLLDPFLDKGLFKKIHLITCNPPYISSSKVSEMPTEISQHEPSLAFDGGAFGVNLLKRLIEDSVLYLRENGYLIFEVGMGQGEMIKKLVERSGEFKNISCKHDGNGNIRVISAQRRENK